MGKQKKWEFFGIETGVSCVTDMGGETPLQKGTTVNADGFNVSEREGQG
ncbi:MAG: hypothetical protein AAFY56_05905 [Pseudomonadota bacterium]